MVKRIITVSIFFCTIFGLGKAQHNKLVTKEQLVLFGKSTTYVVLDENPMSEYNMGIKDAVEKYWKITPFKFISSREFDTKLKDPTASFILRTKTFLSKDKNCSEYNYLNFLMGDKVTAINDMPELLTIPLSYAGVEIDTYSNKLGIFIKFAQEHIKSLQAGSRPAEINNLKYYNKNIRNIKGKTLLVQAEDLSEEVNTLEKIKAQYPYDVKIVSSEEIEKAIAGQTANTIILHQISPSPKDRVGRSYKIIYGVDDSKMYYYNFENISQKRPAGILAKDFKRITFDW